LDLCFLPRKGIGFYTQGSLSLPCLLAMKSSLVYFTFLASFSGSSSTSSLSEALPLLVSASEIEILLGSLPVLEDSATILCFFFFFFLERIPSPVAR
jgi:hypothetical protein